MRKLGKKEKKKRGCLYCLDRKSGKCKHDECPYRELDEYESYNDYLKSEIGIFNELLKAVRKK